MQRLSGLAVLWNSFCGEIGVGTNHICLGQKYILGRLCADDKKVISSATIIVGMVITSPCAVPKLVHSRWPGVSSSLGGSALLADQAAEYLLPALTGASSRYHDRFVVIGRLPLPGLMRPMSVTAPGEQGWTTARR
jgi:hypothetical protein